MHLFDTRGHAVSKPNDIHPNNALKTFFSIKLGFLSLLSSEPYWSLFPVQWTTDVSKLLLYCLHLTSSIRQTIGMMWSLELFSDWSLHTSLIASTFLRYHRQCLISPTPQEYDVKKSYLLPILPPITVNPTLMAWMETTWSWLVVVCISLTQFLRREKASLG
jgi:hypothetical protein